VAIDAIAMRLIDEYRVANKLPPVAPIAAHVQSAAISGLGNFDEDAIEQARVGVMR
jgi:hypothetical protein